MESMKIILNTINDLYSTPDSQGLQRCIKKGILTRRVFDSHEVDGPEEVLSSKGNPVKGRCRVKYKEEYYTLKHSFEEVHRMLSPVVIKGFRHGTKD